MNDLVELTGRPKNKLIQLAMSLEKVKIDTLEFPMLWSEKLDGVFCLALKHDKGKVTIYSRTGEVYTSMKHIERELDFILAIDGIFIFEAYTEDIKQATISGWCRDNKQQHPELHAYVHTYIHVDSLIDGEGFIPYFDLYCYAKKLLNSCSSSYVHFLPAKIVVDMEEAMCLTQKVWNRGGEGGILRNPKAPYLAGKRNKDIIKIKQGVSYDLQVLDIYEGKGKYQDSLGGLICRWQDDQTIKISGMTDAQRKEWWEDKNKIVGKIVQVDAMCLSAKGLLREPRFKGIRHDKMEGDF